MTDYRSDTLVFRVEGNTYAELDKAAAQTLGDLGVSSCRWHMDVKPLLQGVDNVVLRWQATVQAAIPRS